MIRVYEPTVGDEEIDRIATSLRSGWITQGPAVADFERHWADYCGRKYGIAMSSGTAALQAAVAALDLKPRDEVILPTFTMIACAMAVVRGGATPVLVDCDPKTWCMDPEEVEAKVTSRTRAIMPVHIYGHPVDMDPILDCARRHDLAIIEDAAEAHGAEYETKRKTPDAAWNRVGSFGTMSCFSFYANKIVTTGEGGMVLTDDADLAERLRSLRNMCFGTKQRFCHESLGFNFRMTDLQAAIGLAQVNRIQEILLKKRNIAIRYRERLQGMKALQLATQEPWAKNVFWMYGVVLTEASRMDARECASKLEVKGIETRPFFLGMHEQPALHRRGLFRDEHYPIAEHLSRQGLYLPSGPGLKDGDIEFVCDAVKGVLT